MIKIAELRAFAGAAWRIVLGIKIDDEKLALESGEAKKLIPGCRELKIREGLIEH